MFALLLLGRLQTFSVHAVSQEFLATIEVKGKDDAEVPNSVRGPGTVTLRSKKTGKLVQIIKMPSVMLFHRQVSTNVVPGGKQPSLYDDSFTLIFEDFNFDGHQDLAICNGLNSGYGGPSYDVFLFGKKGGKFVKSAALSKFASEHLGMFGVDAKNRTLIVDDKSGAAWHQETTYKMAGNTPKPIKVVVDDATGDKDVVTTKLMTPHGWKISKKTGPLPKGN